MLKHIKKMDSYIHISITKLLKDITHYLGKRKGYVGFVASVYLFSFDLVEDDRLSWFIKKATEIALILTHFTLYIIIYRYIFTVSLSLLTRFINNDDGRFFIDIFFFISTYLIYLSNKDRFVKSRQV